MTDTVTTTATDTATPATETVIKPWYDGASPEVVGYLQTKGWADDPKKAALGAAQAHMAAEKYIGVPAEQILRLPKEGDVEGFRAVQKRLGALDADKYNFEDVKRADGSAPADDVMGFLRTTSASLGLRQQEAMELAGAFIKRQESAEAAKAAEKTAGLETSKQALAKDWADNFDAHKFVAQQGAKAMEVTPEDVTALESVVGYDRVMKMFHKIGVMNGEAKYVQGTNPAGTGGLMSREQAIARKAELLADKDWKARYMGGGKKELNEMVALSTILSSR